MRPLTVRKQIWLVAIATPILIGVFLAGMIVVSALPDDSIEENLRADLSELDEHHPVAFTGRRISGPWSECSAVGLQLGDSSEEMGLVEEALATPLLGNCDRLAEHLSSSLPGIQTARYWHGYSLVSRPVLALFQYSAMRALTIFSVTALLFAVVAIAAHRWRPVTAIPIVVPFFIANSAAIFLYWTRGALWVVTLGAVLALFWVERRGHLGTPILLFFLVGATTSYVDVFTTPLVAALVPLAFFIALRQDLSGMEQLRIGALLLIAWGAGWAVLWSAKWLLALVFVDDFTLGSIVDQAAFRLSGDNSQVQEGLGNALRRNLDWIENRYLFVAAVVYLVPLAWRGNRERLRRALRRSPLLVIIMILPVVWLEVLSNHSQIHAHLTQANLMITMLVLGMAIYGPLGERL